MKTFRISLLFCASALICAAQSTSLQPKIENAKDMKFATIPNVPTCFTGAVEHGDPSSGPSTFFIKGTKGCDVPMHFHSSTEQLIMVNGTARAQMKGDRPRILRAGGFAIAPSRHPHHVTCTSACKFYVVSDGPFDVHYIDDGGTEISFEQAVSAVPAVIPAVTPVRVLTSDPP
jgi:quercetin dioxygenase-like cupin family protein